jgi:hypothetical protein
MEFSLPDFFDRFKFFNNKYSEDVFDLLCGEHIGTGAYRAVYECRVNSDWVIKVELGDDYANIAEYAVWGACEFKHDKNQDWSQWLAPCRYLSPNGKFLIQDRTGPLAGMSLPDKIPNFLDDTHLQNWGSYDGRVVCHDYANHAFFTRFQPKLTKHTWVSG